MEETRERKRRGPLVALLLAAVCLVSVVGTLAFLQTSTQKAENTFVVGVMGDLTLLEHKAVMNQDGTYGLGSDTVTQNSYTLIPGIDVPKDPYVEVKDLNVPAYLFVEVVPTLGSGVSYAVDDTKWYKTSIKGVHGGQVYLYIAETVDADGDPDTPEKKNVYTLSKELGPTYILEGDGVEGSKFANGMIEVDGNYVGGTLVDGDGKPLDETLVLYGYLCQSTGFDSATEAYYVCFGEGTDLAKNIYTVAFDANGGVGAPGVITGYTEKRYWETNMPSSFPTKTGYDFIGWSKDPDATSAEYIYPTSIYIQATDENHTVTLYAVWKKQESRSLINGQALNAVIKGAGSSYLTVDDKVTKVVFGSTTGDNAITPSGAGTDVSAASDGSVMAYREDGGATVQILADLEGGAKIVANPDMSFAFADLSALEVVEGTEYLDATGTLNLTRAFSGCASIDSIGDTGIAALDTSNVQNWTRLLSDCVSLDGTVDLAGVEMKEPVQLGGIFYGCSIVDQVLFPTDLNTSKTRSFYALFQGCAELADFNLFDLAGYSTDSMHSMGYMFQGCAALEIDDIDVAALKAPNNLGMTSMFEGCTGLTGTLDLRPWGDSTSNVSSMQGMFYGASNLEGVIFPDDFDTSNVTSMRDMFRKTGLTGTLNLSSFDASSVLTMYAMFRDTPKLEGIVFPGDFDTSNVTGMNYMFYNSGLTGTLDISSFDTSKVTTMADMFRGTSKLEGIVFPDDFDTSNVVDMTNMFRDGGLIGKLDLSGWDTSKVTSMYHMFQNNSGLTELDLSGWDTSKVTSMKFMLGSLSNITELDLSSFDTSKVSNMRGMFYNNKNLQHIYVTDGKWDTSNVTDSAIMFSGCVGLKNYDESKVTVGAAFIGDGGYLEAKTTA